MASVRLAEAAERVAAACERIAAALEGDAEMQGILAAALGGPAPDAPGAREAEPIDLDALDWRTAPGGIGYTVADGNGGRRAATLSEEATISASIQPTGSRRRR